MPQNRTTIQIGTHFGTPKRLARLLRCAETIIELSSRTRVTELSIAPRYRFFSETGRKMAHASFSQWNTFAPQAFNSFARLGHLLLRRRASSSRRHALPATERSVWRLLLPLCRIQSARRLREDVRIQEIRVPLVGHHLRQAAHEHATPRFARRPPLPTSRPRRTRSPVILIYFGSQFDGTPDSWRNLPKFGQDCAAHRISFRPLWPERVLDSDSYLSEVRLKLSRKFPEFRRWLDYFARQHFCETLPASQAPAFASPHSPHP